MGSGQNVTPSLRPVCGLRCDGEEPIESKVSERSPLRRPSETTTAFDFHASSRSGAESVR